MQCAKNILAAPQRVPLEDIGCVDLPPNTNAASYITSPTWLTPATTPSRPRFSTAWFVGQSSKAETWSVRTRLSSSGMPRSNDRNPASTCAMGIPSLAAASAPAKVEFVSPYTITMSGLRRSSSASIAPSIFPVVSPCLPEPISKLHAGSGIPNSLKNTSLIK